MTDFLGGLLGLVLAVAIVTVIYFDYVLPLPPDDPMVDP